MMLTGQCKEDFLNYYWDIKIKPLPMNMCKREDLELFFDSISEIFKHALIIEWFDLVGIHISIRPNSFGNVICFDWYVNFKCYSTESIRPEATNKAIEKANELYNSNKQIIKT